MRVGSLFSGIGLLDLGLERAGFETIWQVEYDKQASKVLERWWPHTKKYTDITQIDWSEVERPDALAGGFPCQPFSSAGLRKGQSDERYLWPEFYRAIRSLRPRIIIVENVAALIGWPEFGILLGNLAQAGYDAKWACIRASDVGAPHRRERIFVVAYANSNRDRQGRGSLYAETERDGTHYSGRVRNGSQVVADTDSPGLQGRERQARQLSACVQWGIYESAIRRWERITRPAPRPTDDRGRLEPRFVEWMMGAPQGWTDCASRTGALRGLGNGVVVQVAEEIGRWAMEVVE